MRSRITRHLWSVLGEPVPVRVGPDGAPAAEQIAPERPPLELSGRDYAISLLRFAAEIEHGLMVQYLFAAYSLDPPGAPGRAARRWCARWQEAILGIAKEEMAPSRHGREPAHRARRRRCSSTARTSPTTPSCTPPASVCGRSACPRSPPTSCAESPAVWEDDARPSAIKAAARRPSVGGTVNRVGAALRGARRCRLRPRRSSPTALRRRRASRFRPRGTNGAAGIASGERGRQADDGPPRRRARARDRDGRRTGHRGAPRSSEVGEQGEGFGMPEDEEESHFRALPDDLPRRSRRSARTHARCSCATWRRTRRPTSTARTSAPTPRDTETTTPRSPTRAALWAHLFNVRYRKLLVSVSHAFELAEDRTDPASPGPRGSLIHRAFARDVQPALDRRALLVALPARPRPARTGRAPGRRFRCRTRSCCRRTTRTTAGGCTATCSTPPATLTTQLARSTAPDQPQDYLAALAHADRIERDQVRALIAARGRRATVGPTP